MNKMVTLSAHGYTAEILPAKGANCLRLFHEPTGCDLLRTPADPDDLTGNPFVYGMPILFPPNRLADGRFNFEGREYVFPINEPNIGCHSHGSLNITPFETIAAGPDRAAFRFEAAAGRTYLGYPQTFSLLIEYTLLPDGLCQTVTVGNRSDFNMPVGLAFHSNFALPFTPDGKTADISLCLPVTGEYLRNERFLADGTVGGDEAVLSALNSGRFRPGERNLAGFFARKENAPLVLTDLSSGRKLVYRPDEKYRCWMVLAGADKSFVSICPQTWVINAPNLNLPVEQSGLQIVAPGGSLRLVSYLGIEN